MSAIAIVGLACRFADARSPAELWENVLAQRRAFRRIPEQRLRLEDYLRPDPDDPDSLYATEAAVLADYEFDRVEFRVVGSTYRSADLAHWLALEVAAEALADAGFAGGRDLPRETTGVLLGNTLTGELSRANLLRLRWPYVRRVVAAGLAAEGWSAARLDDFLGRLEQGYKQPFPPMTEESLAGGLSNTIAGRICNHFDLGGGGYTVDGACASSLLAVVQACSQLAAGDLEVALAGGVDISLDPFELVGFSRAGALAPDEMRVFDARSQGFIPGEGCGFVVLMRHEDAIARRRRIYAVIRGWGISSDGSGGISRPEVAGQLLAIRRTYARAGFGIGEVSYFEGHGTGTKVGDATEIKALVEALGEAGAGAGAGGNGGGNGGGEPAPAAAPEPLPPLGSVKANIGHTKAAAGVAGLIKASLAVHHQVLPPTTGCEEPHPELLGPVPRLRVLDRPEPWPVARPLRAAVSAMGFGGINSHLVVEGVAGWRRRSLSAAERRLASSTQDAELVLLAAADRAGLARQLERLLAIAPRLAYAELADLAAERARAADAAEELPFRAAVVAARPAELAGKLATLRGWLEREEGGNHDETGETQEERSRLTLRPGLALGRGGAQAAARIGLLFPGQGAPTYQGGGALGRRFEEVAELHARYGRQERDGRDGRDGHGEAPNGGGAGADTAVAQPALVTHAAAGLLALELLGIHATVGVGHSLGELVAYFWAGACDAETLVRIAAERGRAMADLGQAGGAMAAIAAAPERTEGLLAREAGEVAIAAFNSPRSTVVSGETVAVEATMARARAAGIAATRLRVSHAFHSPMVAAVGPLLAATLAAADLRPLARRVSSTVTGGWLDAAADLRQLLLQQLTSPVRFTAAIAAAASEVDLWIEVGAGRALADLAAGFTAAPAVALDAGGPSLRGLLEAAGAAFCAGVPIASAALFDGRLTRPFSLDHAPVFVTNPCEEAPPLAAAGAVPPLPAPPLAAIGATAAGMAAVEAPPPAAGANRSALEVVRQLVAARTELPAAAIDDHSRLLGDLHLNSLSVGQLAVEAARQLGLHVPAAPGDFATATVGQMAEALVDQARLQATGAGNAAEDPHPAGVASWVRAFASELIERPLAAAAPAMAGSATGWKVVAPADHPLAPRLRAELARLGGGGLLLCLPPDPDESQIGLLLETAAAALGAASPPRTFVVQQDGGGGAFARTLHLELPRREDSVTCVVDVPFGEPSAAAWVLAEIAAARRGFSEVRYDAAGTRRVPVLRPLPQPPAAAADGERREPPLAPGEVLLVTGGGKGIAAECALDLAAATGARLALLGRSLPETDGQLAANLERFRQAGIATLYLQADVADPAAVRAAVRRCERELGPVAGVLHGAGVNRPRLLGELDEAAFARTLAPKLAGARNLLAALDLDRLRLFVAFGSIIARTGLPGEADYGVANEWLRRLVERLAAERPGCRCLAVEWSVWAGLGMGERLGRLEALLRQGITPIPPDLGVSALSGLLARPLAAASVIVSGRLGEPPTIEIERPQLSLLRFLDHPRVYYPGIELVVETELSPDSDPYVGEHVFRGDRLFPAVMALEAMAQAAMAVDRSQAPPTFEEVELARPVVVAAAAPAVIRLAALVRAPGLVEVVLRCSATGFQVDHFRALCRFPVEPAAPAEAPRAAQPELEDRDDAVLAAQRQVTSAPAQAAVQSAVATLAAMSAGPPAAGAAAGPDLDGRLAADLYGHLLFHSGRFRRVTGYRRLRARECLADISPDGATSWFSRFLPAELWLGDAAVRDAAIHALQACIPHLSVLPTGVERVIAGRLAGTLTYQVMARERSREGDTFVYDLQILDGEGRTREQWQGLRLRGVQPIPPPAEWPLGLLGPYLERRLQELLPRADLSVLLEVQAAPRGAGGSDLAASRLLGAGAEVRRRPDGKPEAMVGGRPISVSAAHARDLIMVVAGRDPVSCDLEPVAARERRTWRDLLGGERFELAEVAARETPEDLDRAATRVWAAGECLKKAGAPHGAPLVLAAGGGGGGWQLMRYGGLTLATLVAPVRELGESLAIAFLAGGIG
jgi:enediyne polyketide synthase